MDGPYRRNRIVGHKRSASRLRIVTMKLGQPHTILTVKGLSSLELSQLTAMGAHYFESPGPVTIDDDYTDDPYPERILQCVGLQRVLVGTEHAYDFWKHMDGLGAVFRAGTTDMIAHLTEEGIESDDESLRVALEKALEDDKKRYGPHLSGEKELWDEDVEPWQPKSPAVTTTDRRVLTSAGDLSKSEAAQLRAIGARVFGSAGPVVIDDGFAGDRRASRVLSAVRRCTVSDGSNTYDFWQYLDGGGALFSTGTAQIVTEVIGNRVEGADADLEEVMEVVLSPLRTANQGGAKKSAQQTTKKTKTKTR
jgi:hypothetical protein